MVHYHGQMRFRLYVNDGVFKYDMSDMSYDRKIEGMTGRNVSRSTTTHEYNDFEYVLKGVDHKPIIMAVFEDAIRSIKTPLQYLGDVFRKEVQVDKDVIEIFVFPIGPHKRVTKEENDL